MTSNVTRVLVEYIRPVLTQVDRDLALFNKKLGHRMSAKLQSEIISGLIQNHYQQMAPGVRVGAGDHEADLYVGKVPVELKTSRESREWRGGEYSKRAGHYLLVSWTPDEQERIKWCVVLVKLEEKDWRSSGSSSYYATSISLDEALDKRGRVIIGKTRKAKVRVHPVYEIA